MKKYAIYFGVALCLAMAAHKVYDRFFKDQAPAKVGECLELYHPEAGLLELKVVKNDYKNSTSDVEVRFDLMPGASIKAVGRASFDELRELGAKKVECSE